ncbi:MAG: phosphotransferase [Pseudomonadota bacterium]
MSSSRATPSQSAVDQLDLETLGAYLAGAIPGFGALSAAEKFAGGQSNPTFKLTADSGAYVLRRQPPGELLKSAHAVDREYRVIAALRETDVPVPLAHHLCQDRAVIGSMFYVMSFEEGRIFWTASLPELTAPERGALYDDMNRVLAALHSLEPAAIGLEDYGKAGDYFLRQISRWSKQYKASETEPIAAMDRLIEWLPANAPPDDGEVRLIHGDYRLDNIMFHADEPRAIAVLDWELSTLGHPYADLAYQCMQLRLPPTGALKGLAGLDRAELGVPSEADYVAKYCQRRGLSGIPHWGFYLSFSAFRLAAIAQGVYKRGLDGNASSAKAKEFGHVIPMLAAFAEDLAKER